MRRNAMVAAFAVWLVACNEVTPPPPPASFERPESVTFVCVDDALEAGGEPTAFSDCNQRGGEAQDTGDKQPRLLALVTQTTRGEVAVVDLAARRILDSRQDIPGFTFVPVGEQPSAIVVPRQRPQVTYVANFGSRDISVLRTADLTVLAPGTTPQLQPPVALMPQDPTTRGGPIDMVLSPSAQEDALFVAMPEHHAVLRVPIRRCGSDCEEGQPDGSIDVAAIERIDLLPAFEAVLNGDGTLSVPEAMPEPDPYRSLTCDIAAPAPMSRPGRRLPAAELSLAPRPVALAVDRACPDGDDDCPGRILVADEALPVLHVLELDADGGVSVGSPLVTGTPTKDVVVTPLVPRVVPEAGEGTEDPVDLPLTHYIYAIDARQGSVLAMQDDVLLAISDAGGRRSDRIGFAPPVSGAGASTGESVAELLEVLTPAYDAADPETWFAQRNETDEEGNPEVALSIADPDFDGRCWAAGYPERFPRRLRGVYLAVALRDGTVRIVDVHDTEAPNCLEEEQEKRWSSRPAGVVRHQPRLSEFVERVSAQPSILQPGFDLQGMSVAIRSDGSSAYPSGLDCVLCPEGSTSVFPTGPALLGPGAINASEPMTDDPDPADDDAGQAVPSDGGMPEVAMEQAADSQEQSSVCDEGEALVCMVSQPWAAATETFIFAYEGKVPNTNGGSGWLIDDGQSQSERWELDNAGELDFCALGVLGADGQPGQRGDALVITQTVADEAQLQARSLSDARLAQCAELREVQAQYGPKFFYFEIDRATSHKLVLKADEGDAWSHDLSLVRDCMASSLLTYSVHSLESFVVLRANTGAFAHQVVAAGPDRHCELAVDADPLEVGRAYPGEPFRNHVVTLQLRPVPDPAQLQGFALVMRLGVRVGAGAMELDTRTGGVRPLRGVVPTDLRYNPADRQLYMVDVNQRGLMVISLEPFPASLSAAADYN